MVMQMMQNIRENLHDQEDEEELETYLKSCCTAKPLTTRA